MTSRSPECSHRLAKRNVLLARLLVHEACVCNLALRRAVRPVNLAVRQALESGESEFLGECVDARVSEQRYSCIVGDGDRGVGLERPVFAGACALGEIFAMVEVLEEGAHSLEIFFGEVDSAGVTGHIGDLASEVGGLNEESLMRGEEGGAGAATN